MYMHCTFLRTQEKKLFLVENEYTCISIEKKFCEENEWFYLYELNRCKIVWVTSKLKSR